MHSWDANKMFKALPFYNSYIDELKVKKLNNVQSLKELPFYDELSIVKTRQHLVVMPKAIKLRLLIKEMLLFN